MPQTLENPTKNIKVEEINFEIAASEEDKKIDIVESKAKFKLFKNFKSTGNTAKDIFNYLNDLSVSLNTVTPKDKATFFRLLAVMINAGIPIVDSLNTLYDQTKNPNLKKTIKGLSENIRSGKKFSDSMKNYLGNFNESEIGMIEAGEFSGRLNNILLDIATDCENSASMRSKIKGALTYPIVVLFILGAAIVLLMTMVIPKITGLFTGASMQLPLSTQIMIKMSELIQNNLILIVLSPVLLIAAFIGLKSTQNGKYIIDELLLSMPVFGELSKKACLSRFSRVLSNLIKSGVPIVQALKITGNGIGNEVYKKRLNISSRDTAQGIPLGENLRGSERLFPSMIVSMLAIGEKTGEISEVLDKVAEFYEDEVNTMSANLSKLLEPMILAVVGVTVGGIVAAIMQPIISLTDIADKV